jgi:hypothetical protein
MEGVKAGIEYCDTTNLKAEAELVEFFKSAGLKGYYADLDAFAEHVLAQYLASPYAKSWDKDMFEKVVAAGK